MNAIFVTRISNPMQIHLYFTSALEVEGIRAEPPTGTVQDGLVKLPTYTTAEDLMRFDIDNANVNEWYLGTMGEFPLDDLEQIKNSLAKLLSS